jgi:hypothetical protein
MYGRCTILLSAVLTLSGSLAQAGEPGPSAPDCTDRATVDFKRRADLPQPVLNIIDKFGPMGDVGAPFEISDVHFDERLPSKRLVFVRQRGCDLTINYEFGGRAHGFGNIFFRQIGSEWIVLPGSNDPYSRLERSP